jgi:hypothetical protein
MKNIHIYLSYPIPRYFVHTNLCVVAIDCQILNVVNADHDKNK